MLGTVLIGQKLLSLYSVSCSLSETDSRASIMRSHLPIKAAAPLSTLLSSEQHFQVCPPRSPTGHVTHPRRSRKHKFLFTVKIHACVFENAQEKSGKIITITKAELPKCCSTFHSWTLIIRILPDIPELVSSCVLFFVTFRPNQMEILISSWAPEEKTTR